MPQELNKSSVPITCGLPMAAAMENPSTSPAEREVLAAFEHGAGASVERAKPQRGERRRRALQARRIAPPGLVSIAGWASLFRDSGAAWLRLYPLPLPARPRRILVPALKSYSPPHFVIAFFFDLSSRALFETARALLRMSLMTSDMKESNPACQ